MYIFLGIIISLLSILNREHLFLCKLVIEIENRIFKSSVVKISQRNKNMPKVKNSNTRKACKIYPKLTIKTVNSIMQHPGAPHSGAPSFQLSKNFLYFFEKNPNFTSPCATSQPNFHPTKISYSFRKNHHLESV